MPQPLDPAVEALLVRAPRPRWPCPTLRDKAEVLRQARASVAALRASGLSHGCASMTERVPSAQLITPGGVLMGDALRRDT
jgi:hypothetical protein